MKRYSWDGMTHCGHKVLLFGGPAGPVCPESQAWIQVEARREASLCVV